MPRPPRDRDPGDLLPLKPVDLLVLTMLSTGERHGYGIRQDIFAHTAGAVALEAGNLYRTIRILETEGVIGAAAARVRAGDDERRIYYRLLPFGRRVLAAELDRLRALIRLAEGSRGVAPARS